MTKWKYSLSPRDSGSMKNKLSLNINKDKFLTLKKNLSKHVEIIIEEPSLHAFQSISGPKINNK